MQEKSLGVFVFLALAAGKPYWSSPPEHATPLVVHRWPRRAGLLATGHRSREMGGESTDPPVVPLIVGELVKFAKALNRWCPFA